MKEGVLKYKVFREYYDPIEKDYKRVLSHRIHREIVEFKSLINLKEKIKKQGKVFYDIQII